ncbi:MAG: prephenate dehydratase domain-containing protein, partial [Clostridia bacterium]|nr:prephenate dehydratase domain-containing protein [Clostridia bacterium]
MNDLNELRSKIDLIDDELTKIYVERLNLCAEVAKVKAENGSAVNDPSREEKILFRITENVPEEYRLFVKDLYHNVFAASKAYQSALLGKSSPTVKKIRELLKQELTELPTRAAVACQGVKGANSGAAAVKFFPISDITYFKNFEGVFSAVESGLCEYGVLPIENSTAGSVLEVYDLMQKYDFHIVRALKLKIEHCLAGVAGSGLDTIKTVLSHPQALRQCSEFLKH